MTIIEQVHACLPQTYTKENLANFITTNQKQVINHIDKTPLSPEEVADYEHRSSMASRAIDRLDEVKETFMLYYRKGTTPTGDGETYQPQDITIPPTRGVDILKKNRAFADEILEKGYTEMVTDVYLIPYPETSQMVAVTIEGYECVDYTRAMHETEEQLYGKLFIKENGELKAIENQDIEVTSNGTAKVKTKKPKPDAFI